MFQVLFCRLRNLSYVFLVLIAIARFFSASYWLSATSRVLLLSMLLLASPFRMDKRFEPTCMSEG